MLLPRLVWLISGRARPLGLTDLGSQTLVCSNDSQWADFRPGPPKLKFQDPFARNVLAIHLRGGEAPTPGSVHRDPGKITAGGARVECRSSHTAGRVHRDFHFDLHPAMNGPSRPERNVRHRPLNRGSRHQRAGYRDIRQRCAHGIRPRNTLGRLLVCL